jgi:hypothetical protein
MWESSFHLLTLTSHFLNKIENVELQPVATQPRKRRFSIARYSHISMFAMASGTAPAWSKMLISTTLLIECLDAVEQLALVLVERFELGSVEEGGAGARPGHGGRGQSEQC